MNRAFRITSWSPTFWVAVLLLPSWGVHAAATNPPPAKTVTNTVATAKTTSTNTAPVEIPIPLSVFVVPKEVPAEGTDPFFPLSERFHKTAGSGVTNQTAVAELVIKGFSGTVDKPYVIINNATFGVGDSSDVITPQGRTRIRCLEIHLLDQSALVEANGEKRELRFKNGK